MYLRPTIPSGRGYTGGLARGYTLIELMLSLLIMLIITTGAVQLAANVFRTNTQSVQKIQLSQEMRSVIQLISRDMRRSGYKDDALGGFMSAEAISSGVTMGKADAKNVSDCLQVQYQDRDGEDRNVVYRLRLISKIGRVSANFDRDATCKTRTDGKGWLDISNPLLAHISALEFVMNRQVTDIATNMKTGNTIKVGLEQIDIVISATLRSNDEINRSITNGVQLRNQNLSV